MKTSFSLSSALCSSGKEYITTGRPDAALLLGWILRLLAQIYSAYPEPEPKMEKQLLVRMLHQSGIDSQKTVKALKP
ncbi:hypothetical protein CRENBAI_006537 [Crenichthys baileyi]|uniref:Uncharacterized protein n=1 Tax=Crenichthys baileyi TaxID=28760 RepID=A0AAV9SGA5_9TELE